MHDQRYYLGGWWPTMVVVMPGIFPAHTVQSSPCCRTVWVPNCYRLERRHRAQRQGTSFPRCGRASSYRSHLFAGQPPSSSHSVRVLVSLFATAAATYRVWPVSPARSLALIDDMWNVKGFANSYKINSAYMDRKHSSPPPLAVHSRL